MAALLVAIAVMGILASAVLPSWRTLNQREREAELIFRGEQYARAIGLFQRKFAGGFPPNIDTLVQQRFLRKKYKDPITGEDFQVLTQMSAMGVPGQQRGPGLGQPGGGSGSAARPGETTTAPGLIATEPGGPAGPGAGVGRGGVVGVVSKSTKASLRLYNGRGRYNEWQFVYTQASGRIGVPGQGPPGQVQPGMGPGGFPRMPGGAPGAARPGTVFTPGGGPGQPPRRP
jgi:type II secretory pathway pseudopilin PulG